MMMNGFRAGVSLACLGVLVCAAPGRAHLHVDGLDVNGQCVGDVNADRQVLVNELVTAVNNALDGCPRLPITLTFRGFVGNRPFACGTAYSGIGTGDSQFLPSDFRFYVSGIKLLAMTGEEVPLELEQDGVWQYQDVALIDFETGPGDGCGEGSSATNTSVRGSVPAGVYTGIKFDLGLPFELNHGNVSTAPPPLNYTAMFWSWNDGYKFLRVDTLDDKFRVHLGSTGCDGSTPADPPQACARPNLPTITLTGFNPSHSTIDADLAALLADNDIDANQPGTPPGCMGSPDDQDCAPLFRNLGLSFPDGTSSGTQQFFRLGRPQREPDHKEIKVASSSDGGGRLIGHPEFTITNPIPLPYDDCFGGTGDDCEGGMRLFSAVNPGIEPLDESEPEESLFTLADGVPVTLEVTAIDAGLTIRLGDIALDSPGDSVLLGETPGFHSNLETQLLIPGGGEPSGTFSVSFKLTTTSGLYTDSEVITVRFTPTGGGSGHH